MAITLESIIFDETSQCIVWVDEFKISKIAQTNQRTLGGQLVSYELGLDKGIDITLEAQVDTGWLKKSQVVALQALAEVVGATYTLVFETQTFTVQFRHDEAPAVEFTPIIFRRLSDDGDYFTGVIKLRTV